MATQTADFWGWCEHCTRWFSAERWMKPSTATRCPVCGTPAATIDDDLPSGPPPADRPARLTDLPKNP
jgi:Zn finger protein HypA/HybF involved in hydrogenase expression